MKIILELKIMSEGEVEAGRTIVRWFAASQAAYLSAYGRQPQVPFAETSKRPNRKIFIAHPQKQRQIRMSSQNHSKPNKTQGIQWQ
jgi:hypothetical protein